MAADVKRSELYVGLWTDGGESLCKECTKRTSSYTAWHYSRL